jgi:uncharacterized membrane protein YgcG
LSNPIEIVLSAGKRLARLALIRILLQGVLPVVVTVAFAVTLNPLNDFALEHFGYLINSGSAQLLQMSLIVLALVEVITAILLGWRAWLRDSDFIGAAEQIDRYINGEQEIVTLAGLCDPARPEAAANLRSPLFPVLWERVMGSLETFDPRSAFKLEFQEPLVRAGILSTIAIALLSTAAFVLMTRPTPGRLMARRLWLLADAIGTSAAGPAQRQLATASRDVARDLDNPRMPAQQKLAELDALKKEFQKYQSQRQTADAGRGDSSGGGEGQGAGSGKGSGSGNSQTGSGASKSGKGDQQIIELRNDIAKAR